ncbi:YcaO-like family protein [Phytohabitans sp. LJ34]|uniref:YcaO-like family protein n=1 Tax=Phytohabitans sp. LJ34 TaxID=3452217 RepID=UPI003F8C10E5
MRLRDRVPKARGTQRECTAEETYERIRPHLARAGITEVVDVTGHDRLGIPVFTALLPRSVDDVPVYGGKGLTPAEARASAVMEAVERFAAWLPLRPTAIASYAELAAAGRAAVRPADHNLAPHPEYTDDAPVFWVTGHDLLHDEPVLVPHGAVAYGPQPASPHCYTVTTTNGLASGNSVEEAVCHALCEVVERDAMTLAEVTGDRMRSIVDGVPETEWLDPGTLPARARALVAGFAGADVEPRLRSIATDLGVPSILAVAAEGGRQHSGFGTHPDLEVALTRAITECAQLRAAGGPGVESTVDEAAILDASALPTYPSDDIAADVRFLLDRLRAAGLARAVVVDLSPPGIPAHVVRVVVPGLESWAIDRSRLGTRATDAWNNAVALITHT